MKLNQDKLKARVGRTVFNLLLFLLLFGFCFLILQPFVLKVMSAIKDPVDMNDKTVGLIPKHFSTYYFELAISQMNLAESSLMSFMLSLIVSVAQLFSCTLTAYALARLKFKGQMLVFLCTILVLLVPPQSYSIAMYMQFRFFTFLEINLINNPLSVFLLSVLGVGFKSGLYIYLLRNYFINLPKELENAAFVDGASPIGTFFRVILPNAGVMLATVFLFSFCWQWTDTFYSGLLFPQTETFNKVISAIQVFSADKGFYDAYATTVVQNAACVLILIPIMIIFLVCQKFFIKSIATSGLAN